MNEGNNEWTYRVAKNGATLFYDFNFGIIDQTGTKFSTNQRCFIPNITYSYFSQSWKTEWRHLVNVRKPVAIRDEFARWHFGKHQTYRGAYLQSWKCSARLPKSVRNWKEEGHFTVVCSAHCKARSSAKNLQALVRVTVIRESFPNVFFVNYELLLRMK